MKIVIAGGSGQVGTILARAFHASGDEGCPEPPARRQAMACRHLGRA